MDDEISEAEQATAKAAATKWLNSFASDPDLSADTRVAVPVVSASGKIRIWATIGGVKYSDGSASIADDVKLVRGRGAMLAIRLFRHALSARGNGGTMPLPSRREVWFHFVDGIYSERN